MKPLRRATRLGALVLALGTAAGCSNLTESDSGIVSMQVIAPRPATVAVGQSIQLTARALNSSGETVATDISWATPDATITVDAATGLVTGVTPGTGRVQASSNGFSSALVTITVDPAPAGP